MDILLNTVIEQIENKDLLFLNDYTEQMRNNTFSWNDNDEDSPPDVPDTALPRLFERLYRVESSRKRATGGAGIGLSICHNIVTAHDGSISAHHAALGGLEIRVRLPLNT